MDMLADARLTTGDVARALGIDIASVLDLVYRGELVGRPDPHSGRLYITADALAAYGDRVIAR